MLQMLDWANEFGGIYRFCLGYQWVVVISDPKLAMQASEPWMNAWNAGLVSQPWSTCMGVSCRLAMGHLGQDRPVGLWVAPHQGFKSGLGVTQHSGFLLRQVMRLACKLAYVSAAACQGKKTSDQHAMLAFDAANTRRV